MRASPTGSLGVRVQYSVLSQVGIELGTGIAQWPNGHVLGIARLPATAALAPYFGVGAAAGEYWSYDPLSDRATQVYPLAWWMLAEAGLDVRFQSGFALRAYVGLAPLLNPTAFHCDDPMAPDPSRQSLCDPEARPPKDPYITSLPYFGIGLGYSF
ncbi:MAG: hypothetical protein HYZ29_05710 [Myxococcales bacterium]|nr:hypothetical protein [Myxococcales bacterium]